MIRLKENLVKSKESLLKNFSHTLLSGMSFGTGSSLAHHGIDSITGDKETTEFVAPTGPPAEEFYLRKCLLENDGNIWVCQDVLEKYTKALLSQKE